MTLQIPKAIADDFDARKLSERLTPTLDALKQQVSSALSLTEERPRPEVQRGQPIQQPPAPEPPSAPQPEPMAEGPIQPITLPSARDMLGLGGGDDAATTGGRAFAGASAPGSGSASGAVGESQFPAVPFTDPGQGNGDPGSGGIGTGFPGGSDQAGYSPTPGDEPLTQAFQLPSARRMLGMPEPQPPSPLTTLGGTPEAEALTQRGGTAYTLPQPSAAAPQSPTAAPETASAPAVQETDPLRAYARQAAAQAGVDPDIFMRQIQQESGFRPDAVSPAGARGIAQIVPKFHPGVNPDNPQEALTYAAGLMASNLKKYGGDYAKALAAYNAGAGAVDKYGGVPPFAETQNYVSTILGPGGPKPVAAAPVAAAATAMPAPGQSTSQQFAAGELTPNQFTAGATLSSADASAACGPAAAIAFARRNGRNPTLDESVALAREVGWTPSAGMAGPQSEVALLKKMGVAASLGGVDDARIAADVTRGNPVILDTPGHYFVAEKYDPESGKFDFGNSAKILRAAGGNTWYTLGEIAKLGMGAVRAAIHMDNPESPSPSVVAGKSAEIQTERAPEVTQAVDDVSQGRAAPPPPDPTNQWSLLRFDGQPVTGGPIEPKGYSGAVRDPAQRSVMAMEDINGYPGAGNGELVAGGLPESPSDSQPVGPPPRDTRGDYAPRATEPGPLAGTEPGDFQIPNPQPGTTRPIINPDSSITTERSITVTEPDLNDGRPTNIPTVWNGQVVDDDVAIDNAIRSRVPFQSFPTIDDAETAAQQRSRDLGTGRATSIGGYNLAQTAEPPVAGPSGAVEPTLVPDVRTPTSAAPASLGDQIKGAFTSFGETIGNLLGGQKPDLSVGAADIQNRASATAAPGEPSIADVVQRNAESPSPSGRIFSGLQQGVSGLAGAGQEAYGTFTGLNARQLQGETLSPEEEQRMASSAVNVVGNTEGLQNVGETVRGVIGPVRSRLPSTAPAAGIVDNAAQAPAATDRFYHGTGSDFARPDASKFDPNGLFGPGYYVTDSPKVAGGVYGPRGGEKARGYAQTANAGPDWKWFNDQVDEAQYAVDYLTGLKESGRGSPDIDRQIAYRQAKLDQLVNDYAPMESRASGPHVRPVDVPRDLRLLDADAPGTVSMNDVRGVASAIEQSYPPEMVSAFQRNVTGLLDARPEIADLVAKREALVNKENVNYEAFSRSARGKPVDPNITREVGRLNDAIAQARNDALDGNTVYTALLHTWEPPSRFPSPTEKGARKTQEILQAAGYDGIRYAGGKRIPMTDEAGKAIEHNAVVIFPESLDKITNATARTPGGLMPGRSNIAFGAARGAAQGAVAGGYEAFQQEGATPQSVIGAGLVGGAEGAVLGGARRVFGPRGTRTLARAVQQGAEDVPPERQPLPSGRPITLTDEQEIARIRPEMFPEETREPLIRAAREVDWARDQRRGVMPDAQVAALAEDMARRGDAWLGAGRKGRAYNPEETVALRNLVAGQAARVADLTQGIATERAAGSTPDRLIAERAAEAGKLQGYVRLAEGARAEAGRTLRQYATDARLIDTDPNQAIERIYGRLGGRDNAIKAVDEYTQLVQDGADPFQMAHFWAKVENPPPGFEDWFRALRYNSMLSGPRTFEVNTIGNAMEVPWRLARDFGASTLRGRPEELAPELTGLWVGAQKGARAFMETLQHGITMEQAARGDLPRGLASRVDNPVGRGIATTLEAPGRIMQATDELGRQAAYGMAKYRYAAVQASQEGLRGDAWSQRIAQLIEDAPVAMDKAAIDASERMTFHGDMGALGNAMGGVAKVPLIGNLLMPFVKTVYHITARGIDRSPLGIVGTGIDVARGAYKDGAIPKGAAPLGERLGDNAIGGLMGLYMIGQGMQGNLTGAGPDDPEKKNMLRAQGWQPYSVKLGDNYVSYSNWGPVAMPFSLAAGAAEAQLYKKPDDTAASIATDTFRRFAELATEQTYLSGIGAAYRAWKEPDVYGTQWLTQFMQTLVPFGSAINTAGQASDALVRRPDKGDIPQALAARFPGAREDVPVAQDVLGRPVRNQQTGVGAFNPLRVTPQEPNAVISAFQNAQVDIGKPSDTLTIGKQHVDLTPEEQRAWQRYRGDYLMEYESDLGDPEWASTPPDQKQKVLRRALTEAAKYANKQLTADMDDRGDLDTRLESAYAKNEQTLSGVR